jgi:hypothetical protein
MTDPNTENYDRQLVAAVVRAALIWVDTKDPMAELKARYQLEEAATALHNWRS